MTLRRPPRKSTRVGRTPGSFTQSRRLDYLRAALETHTAGMSLDDMATVLHVSTRSVRRYLEELSVALELEVVAGEPRLWRIKPSERGRAVTLRRAQAHALLAARRVFDLLRGSALFDEIDLALRQIEQVAHRPVTRTAVRGDVTAEARLEDRFAIVPLSPRAYAGRGEDIDAAFQAVAETALLRFRYRGDGGEGKGARVTAQPYALVLQGGAVTCVARDVGTGLTRAFVLDRMSEVTASQSERFELPEFALADWLQGDFGVAWAPRSLRVMVELDPRGAEIVRRRKVHPSQRVGVSPDGRVAASLVVPAVPEVVAAVRAWILGFGAAARVLEPRELADEVVEELRRAVARYGP